MAQLIDAIQALQRENKETLWGSMVKQTMIRKNPAFNESYYGYSTFSKLLEEAAKQQIVTLERDEKSGTYIMTAQGLEEGGRGLGHWVGPWGLSGLYPPMLNQGWESREERALPRRMIDAVARNADLKFCTPTSARITESVTSQRHTALRTSEEKLSLRG